MADEGFLNIDLSAGENINKLLGKVAGGVKNVGAELKKAGKGGSIIRQLFGDSKETKQIQQAQKEFERTLKEQKAALAAVNREIQNAKSLTHLDALQEKARGIKDEIKKAADEFQAFQADRMGGGMDMGGPANFQQGGMALSQLLRQLGGDDMENFLTQLGGIVDTSTNLADNFMQLKETANDLIPVLAGGADGVVKLASKIPLIGGSLSGVLGGMSTSLVGLLGIAAPVALAIGGVVAALYHMEEANKGVRQSVQATIRAWDQMNENRRNMTTEEMRDRASELEAQIADNQEFVDSFGGAVDQAFTEAQQRYGDFLARIGFAVAGQSAGIDSTTQSVQEHQAELDAWRNELSALNAQLETGEPTTRDLEAAHEELTNILEREAQAAAEYKEQIQQYNDELKLSRGRELEDRAIADRRAAENHANEMRNIEEEGNQRIEDIRAESLKSIADLEKEYRKSEEEALNDLTKALADLVEETQKAEAELKSRFMESEVKELKRHLKDMSRAENDYQKERLRRLEDLNDELLQAEMENDVVRFIQAQQQGEKDLRRMAEDHNEEMSQGEQDWLEERQEQREQFQQELEDLRNNAIERRVELQEQYNEERAERAAEHAERLAEIRTQTAERLAAERAGIQAQIEEVKQRYEEERRLQAEDRDLQDRRQQEDNERRLKQIQEQYDKETKLLNDEAAEQLAIIQGGQNDVAQVIVNSYTSMVNQLKAVWAAARASFSFSGSSVSGSSGGKPGSGGGKPGTPKKSIFAAEGGLFGPHTPTTVTLGEGRYPEAVVPIRHSRLPSGLNGPTFAMNGDIIISGADVTKADVEAAFATFALVTAQSIADQRAGYSGGYG